MQPYRTCCGIQSTCKNVTGGYLPRDHFLPWVNKDHCNERNISLAVVLRKYSMLMLFKTLYITTIYSVTCRHIQFHYENLISHLIMHNEIWQVSRDLHRTNLKIFGSNSSPEHVTETQYRERVTISFARQSDNLTEKLFPPTVLKFKHFL